MRRYSEAMERVSKLLPPLIGGRVVFDPVVVRVIMYKISEFGTFYKSAPAPFVTDKAWHTCSDEAIARFIADTFLHEFDHAVEEKKKKKGVSNES